MRWAAIGTIANRHGSWTVTACACIGKRISAERPFVLTSASISVTWLRSFAGPLDRPGCLDGHRWWRFSIGPDFEGSVFALRAICGIWIGWEGESDRSG